MKFTHQIKFNSVPEWRDHYIDYAHLKKLIYAIAKEEQHVHGHEEDHLGHPLLTRGHAEVESLVTMQFIPRSLIRTLLGAN